MKMWCEFSGQPSQSGGQKKRHCSDMPNVVSANSFQWTPTKNLLSANQFFSLIDMKRKFINSDNHKFHQYQ